MKNCRQCRYFYHSVKHDPSICINKKSPKFPNRISRDGRDHVCSLFRPIKPHNPSIDQSKVKGNGAPHNHPTAGTLAEIRGLRFIESLRSAYSGREIWVLASGPSLDDLPRDFLAVDETVEPDEKGNRPQKVSIAVKEAGMIFPGCTYNMWAFRDYPLRHIYFPRHMLNIPFSKLIFSIRKTGRENYYGKQAAKATYMRYVQGGTLPAMKAMCDAIVAGNSSVYYGIGTITHLAMAAALVMGASRVSLVGCDHGAIGGKIRAQSIKGGYGWGNADMRPYENMRVGTNFLANYFKGHGVEIVRYYHGRGYEPVGDVVEDEETIREAEDVWKNTDKDDWWDMKKKDYRPT